MSRARFSPEEIKQSVSEHYGKVAEGAISGSCSPGSDCCSGVSSSCCSGTESTLYTQDELANVPTEAANSSRGCGNPTALASLKEGEIVLDLGSGGGIDVLLAARRVGPKGFVYGLDMTDAMLNLANQNAQRAGLSNVQFLKGDIESIPLPNNSVDVIISNCVINLAPDKSKVLREAFRVLKPGGRLAVSDIVIDKNLDGLPLSQEKIRTALSWVGCIAGALTSEQYKKFLIDAGFTSVNLEIRQRYAVGDIAELVPAKALAEFAPTVLTELVGRFTSSSVTAIKPL
jgi:ubiquinone/menaquinone biosynthesis C-methylase UbiE